MTKFAEGYYLAKRVESDEFTVIYIYEMDDPWSDEMEDRLFIETIGAGIPDVLSNYSWGVTYTVEFG